MKAKVTEQGVIIPKSLLPDVDEVDIRRRNGVIEVAPVGENGHRARGESKGKVTLGRQGKNEDYRLWQPRDKPLPKDSADDRSRHEKSVVQTRLTMWKSFYDSGCFTVPVYFDECVRPDEGPMTLVLGRGTREIQAYVNRSETQHGNARIMGGASRSTCLRARRTRQPTSRSWGTRRARNARRRGRVRSRDCGPLCTVTGPSWKSGPVTTAGTSTPGRGSDDVSG